MYKKIHIKNAIFLTIMYEMYLKFFESFTATVKFRDSQNERNMIRFLDSLIKQCKFSTSQSEI